MSELIAHLSLQLFYQSISIGILFFWLQRKHYFFDIDLAILKVLVIGCALPINTLILYYSLLLFPYQDNSVYCGLILCFWLLMGVLLFRERIKISFSYKEIIYVLSLFIAIIGVCYLFFRRPILEHDALEYISLGEQFYKSKSIIYQKNHYFPDNGFYYVGLHGFLFPLIYTFERFTTAFVSQNKLDYLFKIANFSYFSLLVIFFYQNIRNLNLSKPLLMLIFIINYGLVTAFFKIHLDGIRLFLGFAMFFAAFKYRQDNKLAKLVLFAAIAGLAAFVHSINVFLFLIIISVLFLFEKQKINQKLIKYALASLVFLIFGGIHYILDVFWGTGWILKS